MLERKEVHALRVKARIVAIHLSEKICRQPEYAEHIGVSIKFGTKKSDIANTIHENHYDTDFSQSSSVRSERIFSRKVLTNNEH